MRRPQLGPQGGFDLCGSAGLEDRRLEAMVARFQRPQRLLQGFLECAPNGHGLAYRLHLGGQGGIRLRELFEGKARYFDHTVVDSRFERCRRDTGNIIADFVQRVAHRQLGGNFRDRKASRLGGQGRTPRHPWVHLDHHHVAIGRVDGKLDVRAPGFDPNRPDDTHRRIAHVLILFITQRLRRCDGDAVTSVHTHGIDIFDGTDNHDIIRQVTHDFQLILFPAQDRCFDEDLVLRTRGQAPGDVLCEFLQRMGDIPSRTAQRERGPNDQRQPQLGEHVWRFVSAGDARTAWDDETNILHDLLEQVAVLGLLDGFEFRPNQFDPVMLEHSCVSQSHRQIEGRLPTHSR